MTGVSERLDAIEARKDAATPGPWFLNDCEGEVIVLPEVDLERVARNADGTISSWGLPSRYPPERRILEVDLDTWDEGEDAQDDQIRANAEFIAAAPEDVAYLLGLARKQQAALDAVKAACDRIITNADGHKPPGPPHPTREQATAARIRAAITEDDE